MLLGTKRMVSKFLSDPLYQSVKQYKRRFFLNLFLKGLILFLALGLAYFLFLNLLEYFGWFGSGVRAVFLFSFLALIFTTSFIWIWKPLYGMLYADKMIADETAAIELGRIFPQVKDKLLNILQLGKASSDNQLAIASIQQKSAELAHVPFDSAIRFRENQKYLRYILPVLFLAAIGFIFLPGLFTESPKRIVQFDKLFPKPAPFTFRLLNPSLTAYQNEDFTVHFVIEGSELPENVGILFNGQRQDLLAKENGQYEYTFPRMQEALTFQLEGAHFFSQEFEVQIINRPLIGSLNARLVYPSYLNKNAEYLKNIGNLTVPEGTSIFWEVNCLYTDKILIEMSHQNTPQVIEAGFGKGFTFSSNARKSFGYKLKLVNKKAEADGELDYSVSVVPDALPKVTVLPVKDTSLFRFVLLGGTMEDDHGFSSLKLFYKINRKGQQDDKKEFQAIPIRFLKGNNFQNFYLNWQVDSLALKPGDKLEYFVKVWDNDGVNGPKPATSTYFTMELPSEKTIREEIKNQQSETAQNLGTSYSQSKNISKQLDQLQDKLKSKKELNWQDKKNIEDLLEKQNDLRNMLEDLQKQNETLNEMETKFSPLNEELAEKTEQLQELMKEILDDETLKLYQELQKLLEEKNNSAEIKEMLDKLENKQERFDKELERALEMFKQLKFEKGLEQAIQQTDKLSKEQEQLSQKSQDEKQDLGNLQNEQQKENQDFNELKQDIKKLEELNKSLQQKNEFDPEEAIQKSISEKQQNSSNQLQQGNRKGAQKQQKSAAEQMQDLKEQLQASQQEMEKETVDENIKDLRYLLENLLALSFEQETLMKEFKRINQTDPRYVNLLQREIKLKEDAKMVEDSLFALGKRVFQLQKFVTKEVGDMNDYVKESIVALKQRRPDISAGKQQFAMTSMNNLALMLSEVLKQLQEQQQMKSKPGSGQCKKPGGKSKAPSQSMSDMQKELNKRIEALKNGGKQGKEFSQELAQLIAQQQSIRKMMKDAEGKTMDAKGKQQLKELAKKMEETEKELAFKQLSQQTIMRQNEIMTRLLESEKAQREREFEEKRESNSGNQELNRQYPPELDKYLKEKEKQIEMLKSTPPSLNPYYKEKVGQYFQKISE